jgi:hypothetical protein
VLHGILNRRKRVLEADAVPDCAKVGSRYSKPSANPEPTHKLMVRKYRTPRYVSRSHKGFSEDTLNNAPPSQHPACVPFQSVQFVSGRLETVSVTTFKVFRFHTKLLCGCEGGFMTIEQALEAHEDELLARANVVAVGVGERNGKEVIKVLVEQKKPRSELKPEDVIPETIEGFETTVEEVGQIEALATRGSEEVEP